MMSREMDGMFGGIDQYEEPLCDVSISTGSIDNSVFQVPAGYKKVTVKEFLIKQEQSEMDDDISDEEAKEMAEYFSAMNSEPKKMDIHDIKVCSAGLGKSFKLDLSDEGEKEPDELDVILKKNTKMVFEFQDIQTCSYIPASKVFGVKIAGSSVQGALFYKGEKEYIQVSGIIKSGETIYGYGTHTLFDQDNLIYMLISNDVYLNDYLNKYMTLKGKKVQGYPLNEGDPELLEVIAIINDN